MKRKTALDYYIHTLLSQSPLTLDEELSIYYNIFINNKTPQIMNRLIESHMPIAVQTARRYNNRGIDFEDLLDLAISETVRAAYEYNPGVVHKQRFNLVLINRLKVSMRAVFRETKKLQSYEADEQIVCGSDSDVDFPLEIKKTLKGKLTDIEEEVITYRWFNSYTQDDTARLMGRSSTWIREIEVKARNLIKGAIYEY